MPDSKLKFSTFTDESGQDSQGITFVVVTVVSDNFHVLEAIKLLEDIEKLSDKRSKWNKSNNKRREKYIDLLLKSQILQKTAIFYSEYKNKSDYIALIGAHLAKTIINKANVADYKAKVFIDSLNHKEIAVIKKELKTYSIRYSKIRAIKEESSSLIRLADSICGMIRDLDMINCPKVYKRMLKKVKKL